MAYSNLQIEWTDLITFGPNGIQIADYPQIRSALANKFKLIYGQDIDLSTSSADGIYVETLSLLVNNILQSFKTFYGQLDIRTASGVWLDMLCALSNITRKPALASTCNVRITLDSSEIAQSFNEIKLLDQGGKTWTWRSSQPITLQPGVANDSLVFTCDELGPVSAPIGWINTTVNATPMLNVEQLTVANEGSYIENDTNLRARQHNIGNGIGMTTLDSIAGALQDIVGIDDVRIYNNDGSYTADASTAPTGLKAKDGTDVALHGIYVVLRQASNVAIADSNIGTVLFNKLTAGIRTTQSNVSADRHSFEYIQYVQQVPTGLTSTVHWRKCTPIHPNIVITIKPNSYFASANDTQANSIATNVMQYVNKLQLSNDIELIEIEDVVRYSDMRFRGRSTYSLESITIDGNATDYTNPDTYFNYTNASITRNGDNIVITLS